MRGIGGYIYVLLCGFQFQCSLLDELVLCKIFVLLFIVGSMISKDRVVFLQFQGEVNCVKWNPTGSLLASCSDDNTAKVLQYSCCFLLC